MLREFLNALGDCFMDCNSDIFFFGAGFSKSLISAYPTLTELSEDFLKKDLIYKNEKIYADNLEELLTYLISPSPFKTREDILRDEASYLEKIKEINEYFLELRKKNFEQTNKDKMSNIETLSKYINENKCPCITLNYDLLLEEMLFLTHQKSYQDVNSYDVFYKMPIINIMQRGNQGYHFSVGNKSEDYFKEKSSEIFKLHGSINWFYDNRILNSQIYFDETMIKHCLDKTKNSSGIVIIDTQQPNINYIRQLKLDLNPLIIPPIFDKQSHYNHIIIQSLWNKSYELIKNAKNIYIYGFSFPMTDLSISYLFKSALAENRDCKIYVINTKNNLDEKKKRYEEIFGNNRCNFDFCCDDNLKKLAEYLKTK